MLIYANFKLFALDYYYIFKISSISGISKTATFSIPILQRIDTTIPECQAVILTTSREMVTQIQNVVIALGEHLNVQCHACISRVIVNEDVPKMQLNSHIVVGTPGRVHDLIIHNFLRTNHIKLFVVDEAYELLCRGYKDQMQDFFHMLPSDVQVILLSATVPTEVLEFSAHIMHDPVKILDEEK